MAIHGSIHTLSASGVDASADIFFENPAWRVRASRTLRALAARLRTLPLSFLCPPDDIPYPGWQQGHERLSVGNYSPAALVEPIRNNPGMVVKLVPDAVGASLQCGVAGA